MNTLAFSNDEQLLVAGAGPKLFFWNLTTPFSPATILDDDESNVRSTAFNNENELFVSSGESGIRIRDSNNLHVVKDNLKGHSGPVTKLLFSKDDKLLVSSSYDSVRVWTLEEPPSSPLPVLPRSCPPSQFSMSDDGTKIAISCSNKSSDTEVEIWDISQSTKPIKHLKTPKYNLYGLAISPNKRWVAGWSGFSLSEPVVLWDLHDKSDKGTILPKSAGGLSLAFSKDSETLYAATFNAKVMTWNLKTKGYEEKKIRPYTMNTVDLQPIYTKLSTYGQYLFSFDNKNKTCLLWDLKLSNPSPQTICQLTTNESFSPESFSPDEKYFSLKGSEGTTALCSHREKDRECQLLHKFDDEIISTAFSSDSKKFAASGYDQSIKIWEIKDPTAEPIVLTLQEKNAKSLTFSPKDNKLISLSKNLLSWNIDTSQLAEMVCSNVGRNLTRDEWRRFVGVDLPYESTCNLHD